MSDQDFDLLVMLDSPLLEQLAPELVPFRQRVLTDGAVKDGCSSCEERKRVERLVTLQIEIANIVEADPALKSLVPQLLASAKQVFNDHSSRI